MTAAATDRQRERVELLFLRPRHLHLGGQTTDGRTDRRRKTSGQKSGGEERRRMEAASEVEVAEDAGGKEGGREVCNFFFPFFSTVQRLTAVMSPDAT